MAHAKGSRHDPDDEPDIDADEGEEEDPEEPRPRSPRRRHARPERRRRAGPVRRWKSGSKDEPETEEESVAAGALERKPVFWRARDSLYFEPLVALAIIVLLLVGLFAYTQNWPPVYVVESDSMQHGPSDVLGLINTGDLVLAQKVSTSGIVPYVTGESTGYSTYGEYGDVILYQPDGVAGTPVIHRAIVYLVWDSSSNSYSAPGLIGLPCGNPSTAAYSTPGTPPTSSSPANCGTSGLTGTLDLFHVGWTSVNLSLPLKATGLGDHSGFLTMGDNNFVCSGPGACTGLPDQGGSSAVAISSLVEPPWVVGVARGMIPWFGAVKLLLGGQASMVPSQSWQFLGLTIAGVIALSFGVHYALRAEGIETPLRKEEEEEEHAAEDADDGEEEEGRARRWLNALRPWHHTEDDEDEEEGKTPRSKHPPSTSLFHGRRGRPRPQVRRTEKHPRSRHDDEDL